MPQWLLAIANDVAIVTGGNLASGTATLSDGAVTVVVAGMPNTAQVLLSYRASRASASPLMLGAVTAGAFVAMSQDYSDSTSTLDWVATW